jgi:hypothetical protein
MRLISLGIALGLLEVTLACKPRSDAGTKLKHTFGHTSVSRTKAPEPCNNSGEDTPEFRYATALIDYITSKNPGTFTGNLSRKYLCVQIMKTDGLNASMEASNGTMRFFKKILHPLPGLESDAAKAATIAHELAHFSMSHHESSRDNAPPGYDRAKEAKLKTKVEQVRKRLDDANFKAIQSFINANNNEVSRTIDQVITNQGMIDKFKTSFPKYLMEAHQQFRQGPSLDSGESLLLEIDTWIVEADKLAAKKGGPISADLAKQIKSVLSRRELIRDPDSGISNDLAKAELDLERHRLPILQFEEQEADEVGFELYLRAGFDPDIFPQSFIHLAKAVRADYECDPMNPLSPEPSRYREGISFNKVHPDICWRYWDTKYIERRKHAADYKPLISKNPIINLPEMDKLRAALAN